MNQPKKEEWTCKKEPLSKALLAWFDVAKRDMPWRKTRDPYAIWLSETMLQQTQVETVKPFYHKFLERFPTVADLAGADLQEVLRLWAGLGYYRRAKHLHAAAREMVEKFGGKVPETAAQLLTLKGVGRYTAGAVASIAFGEPVAVLDGNVMRVLARVGAVEEDIALPQSQKRLWVMAESLVAGPPVLERPGDFNQALMELGATVCVPGVPRCLLCPIQGVCEGFLRGIAQNLPIKTPKRAVLAQNLRACLIFDSRGRILLLRRPKGGIWEDLWEVPVCEILEGGKGKTRGKTGAKMTSSVRGTGVNLQAGLADVLGDALGLRLILDVGHRRVTRTLTHRRLEYWVHRGACKLAAPAVKLPACEKGMYQAYRWVRVAELSEVPMATGMKKVIEAGMGEAESSREPGGSSQEPGASSK